MQRHPAPSVPRSGRLLFEIPLALVLAAVGVYMHLRAQVGDGGMVTLNDRQVLVKVDHRTGELTADDRPGTHTFVPGLEEVFLLDRGTLKYVMGAGQDAERLKVAPCLIVRGSDGANYAFKHVEVQVALDSARADLALVDHGGDADTILRLVDAYTRPILIGQFGRFGPPEIVLPENKQAGTEAALAELREALQPHGIRVLELSVSKPEFAPDYQNTIHRQKVAEQDIERLRREREELVQSLAGLERDLREAEERKLVKLEASLAEKLRLAGRAAEKSRAKADQTAADQLTSATLQRDEAVAKAAVHEARHRADAESFQAQLAALESQGELAVRAALVERLGSITFDLVPWAEEDQDTLARQTKHGDL